MADVDVVHVGGDQFRAHVRGHTLTVDQPGDAGGGDVGPTPTELLIVSLATCVAHYARRYLARHGLPVSGLRAQARYVMASKPARVGRVEVTLELPADVPADRRDAVLTFASHCVVHNTLAGEPAVAIALAPPPQPTAAAG